MAGIEYFEDTELFYNNLSASRTTIMTPFFANNVVEIKDIAQAYNLAKSSSGVVELTGAPVYNASKLGLPENANQLLLNDGAVVGRCSAARRIAGDENCDMAKILPVLREVTYQARFKKMYKAQAIVGLDKDFMIKANLLIPEGFEFTMYSWLLNFQCVTDEIEKLYKQSKQLPQGDIYIFSDPDWKNPDYPYGLCFFDPKYNCAAILGMRYFGEHKKGTLTLAWNTAVENGFVACHGGMKQYKTKDKTSFQAAFFGLSGSGKSTLTHAKHNDKYDITVLHDDAFIINSKEKYSIALEPTYFDKTCDYPINCEDNKYILTQQNNGVVPCKDGKLIAVTGDIRNGNGRAIKSAFWSKNRVNRIDENINAVFWLMKTPVLPPVLKITGASLSSALGATLATKRTSAERIINPSTLDSVVIEPYANPFRVYPLEKDYNCFKNLFENNVDCYILNTSSFMGKKINADVTLSIIEKIVNGEAEFEKWGNFSDIYIMQTEGYYADLGNNEYKQEFIAHLQKRIDFVISKSVEKNGADALPEDALYALKKELEELQI